jgi:hypothetical protein
VFACNWLVAIDKHFKKWTEMHYYSSDENWIIFLIQSNMNDSSNVSIMLTRFHFTIHQYWHFYHITSLNKKFWDMFCEQDRHSIRRLYLWQNCVVKRSTDQFLSANMCVWVQQISMKCTKVTTNSDLTFVSTLFRRFRDFSSCFAVLSRLYIYWPSNMLSIHETRDWWTEWH